MFCTPFISAVSSKERLRCGGATHRGPRRIEPLQAAQTAAREAQEALQQLEAEGPRAWRSHGLLAMFWPSLGASQKLGGEAMEKKKHLSCHSRPTRNHSIASVRHVQASPQGTKRASPQNSTSLIEQCDINRRTPRVATSLTSSDATARGAPK